MKTFKTLFGMMAVAMMAASCNDVNEVQAPELASAKTIHVKATIAPKNFDATTRALVLNDEDNPTKVFSNWEEGEKITFSYERDDNGKYLYADVEITAVDENGVATVEADFPGAIPDKTVIKMQYPAGAYEPALDEQSGEFTDIVDAREGTTTLVYDAETDTFNFASGTKLNPKYAIVRFNVQDEEGTGIQMAEATLCDADDELITHVHNSVSEFYIMMKPMNEERIYFYVEDYDAWDRFAEGIATFEAGKFYNIDLKVSKPQK